MFRVAKQLSKKKKKKKSAFGSWRRPNFVVSFLAFSQQKKGRERERGQKERKKIRTNEQKWGKRTFFVAANGAALSVEMPNIAKRYYLKRDVWMEWNEWVELKNEEFGKKAEKKWTTTKPEDPTILFLSQKEFQNAFSLSFSAAVIVVVW